MLKKWVAEIVSLTLTKDKAGTFFISNKPSEKIPFSPNELNLSRKNSFCARKECTKWLWFCYDICSKASCAIGRVTSCARVRLLATWRACTDSAPVSAHVMSLFSGRVSVAGGGHRLINEWSRGQH